MAITPLPTPPSRDDPTNFATRADAFLGALPDFATEANALAVDVNADAADAAQSVLDAAAEVALAEAAVVEAETAAAGAAAAANVTKWISGTTYTEGSVVWSPITYLSYRRKSTGGGTTDPSSDTTNWAQAAGTGDVTLIGTQTLTNKTIEAGTFTNGYTEEVYALSGTALNPANGSIQTKTLSANTTFTDSFAAGQSMTLMIDDGSAYTVTWPTITWKTGNGSAPTLNTSGYTVIQLWKVNSTLYGARVGDA